MQKNAKKERFKRSMGCKIISKMVLIIYGNLCCICLEKTMSENDLLNKLIPKIHPTYMQKLCNIMTNISKEFNTQKYNSGTQYKFELSKPIIFDTKKNEITDKKIIKECLGINSKLTTKENKLLNNLLLKKECISKDGMFFGAIINKA